MIKGDHCSWVIVDLSVFFQAGSNPGLFAFLKCGTALNEGSNMLLWIAKFTNQSLTVSNIDLRLSGPNDFFLSSASPYPRVDGSY